jgi:hypothetical protein
MVGRRRIASFERDYGYDMSYARDIAESDRLRRQIVTQWGDQALVSLALTMASSRLYPSLK